MDCTEKLHGWEKGGDEEGGWVDVGGKKRKEGKRDEVEVL